MEAIQKACKDSVKKDGNTALPILYESCKVPLLLRGRLCLNTGYRYGKNPSWQSRIPHFYFPPVSLSYIKRRKKRVTVISEQDLLLRARQLDPCVLAEIYDRYGPRLYRYAVRLLGDACTAEDCVAETFSRFLQAIRTPKGPSDFLQAYLYRTIHNLVVDHYRHQLPTQALNENTPTFGNIEASADQNISKLRVRAAIHELTPDQQKVIALKFLEGWENEEIAHTLNKPVGAVKSLQHRALMNLKKILLDDEVEHVER